MNSPLWDHARSVAATRILVEVGEEHGVECHDALAGTGLGRADLLNASLEVEADQEMSIARNILRELDYPSGLGVEAGRRYTVGSLGLWGFTLMTSPTGLDLVRLGTRYAGLSFAFIRPVCIERTDRVIVRYDDTDIPADVRDFFVERELAKILHLCPAAFGPRVGFHVETKFDETVAVALRAVGRDREVIPNRSSHDLVFSAQLLAEPLPQADPATARTFEAKCAETLQHRQQRGGYGGRVRTRLLAHLGDVPGIEEVAARLNVDERTLRRKLAAEGTSYRQLTDEVRSTIATELLTEGQLTVEEVAVRLGYNDAAAFSRAFKRWTGRRPGSIRRGT